MDFIINKYKFTLINKYLYLFILEYDIKRFKKYIYKKIYYFYNLIKFFKN